MAKKRFIVFLLIMAMLPLSNMYVNATQIPLRVGYNDPTLGQTNPQKTPILIPEISIEDYTLTFDTSCIGCVFRMLNEYNILVYSTTVTSNTLILPSYLSGTFEIRLETATYYYYGYIYL